MRPPEPPGGWFAHEVTGKLLPGVAQEFDRENLCPEARFGREQRAFLGQLFIAPWLSVDAWIDGCWLTALGQATPLRDPVDEHADKVRTRRAAATPEMGVGEITEHLRSHAQLSAEETLKVLDLAGVATSKGQLNRYKTDGRRRLSKGSSCRLCSTNL